MNKREEIARLREDAWLGDAVLSLYARGYLLEQEHTDNAARTEAYHNMTSNHFLACLGEPTAVEAQIGRLYKRDGLEAAFQWLDEQVKPIYEKQESNRQRKRR